MEMEMEKRFPRCKFFACFRPGTKRVVDIGTVIHKGVKVYMELARLPSLSPFSYTKDRDIYIYTYVHVWIMIISYMRGLRHVYSKLYIQHEAHSNQ